MRTAVNQSLQPTARGSVDFRYDLAYTKVSVSSTAFLTAAELNVKLTARGARDQLNVAYASPLPWPDGPLRAPPNHGNGADCGAALRERAHA